ncbi:MAG: heparinase II/III family protein, partial [Caulobacterales bacterium]|nr:heparinase II/III family protein [Caulobacterales bacterium]
GAPARGRDYLEGRFAWGGERVSQATAQGLWDAAPPTERWRDWAHGFSWLRDLTAAHPMEGAGRARAFVDGWIAAHGQWSAETWRPDIVGERVLAWLGAAHVLFPSDDADAATRLESLARQARFLLGAVNRARPGRPRLRAAVALAAAGACLPDEARAFETGLRACGKELDAQIAADGGHSSRSPEATGEILADLLALEAAIAARDHALPDPIRRAIDRLGPMLGFFRLADGGLPAFHGGGEGDRGMIEAALAAADAPKRPFGFAPNTGYHRVSADGAVLMFDAGAPAAGADAETAHASPLAFEFAPTGGRLIVNCGWSPDQPDRFREPVRATAAHSTLVIDDTSSMRLADAGAKREAMAARPARAPSVYARRTEEELGVWIEGGHEGYRAQFGLSHRRRIYVDAKGGDLRGEDTLFRPVDAEGPADGPPARFAIRFHLHTDVSVNRSRDGRSALLTLPNGEGWRFRSDAGALAIEPSIYLAAGGAPRETRQLVLAGQASPGGAIDRPPNRTRWALQRLGRAPSA